MAQEQGAAGRKPLPRRKRKHPARSAKIITAGVSASAVLALTAVMGAQARSAADVPAATQPVPAATTSAEPSRRPDAVVVIEHRIVYVTPTAAPATPKQVRADQTVPRRPVAVTRAAPAPPPAAPAPVSRSNGSTGGSR